ncbi:uncharacterized protein LOC118515272 [Anopheles stephensi]|uniref:uncharacterized protein LOC118515272 n=1 Tax=Anopheles stephensi TaxID=30069 RepID=UPI001658845E|nr:uncharacterized protein LOC118515272 [Anopheles stephensi]XP_035917857.1 uncharacterized protein LOC118515272 [Anopheles stephensi]XP_035917858.1 uncharacterized protein LOC118515272 [Anopheles stephensi]XP_035917860.1 uncharacterized protein LOC118515272 [Anopheles stephensi]
MNLDKEIQHFHNENTIQHSKSKSVEQTPTSMERLKTPVVGTTHGTSYSLLIAMLTAVRSYHMNQVHGNFNFSITLEDPQGGKFDDIVFHRPLEKISLYMQCKHKAPTDSTTPESTTTPHTSRNQETIAQNYSTQETDAQISSAPEITLQNSTTQETVNTPILQNKKQKAEQLIVPNAFLAPKSPFSIAVHFKSFLEIDPIFSKNNYYCLCTNAVIDPDLRIEYFSEFNPSTHYIFSCYQDLDAKFYQFNIHNQWEKLNEKLRDASLSYLGTLLAKSIHGQQTMNSNTIICNLYAVLVNSIIEKSDQIIAVSSPPVQHTYKFKEAFQHADKSSALGKIREVFLTEYKKLLPKNESKDNDVWNDIRQKGIKMDLDCSMAAMEDAFNSMNNQNSYFTKVDEKIAQFYSEFVLICTPDEEILRRNAKQLLAELTDIESDIVFDTLCTSIFEVLKYKEVLEINSNYVNTTFQKLKRNIFYTQLKTSTKEYIATLEQKYPHGLIDHKWLESSCFFQFLCNKSAFGTYHYRSSVDLNISAMIILETLNVLQTQCLFIFESNYHQSKALEEILENIFEYNDSGLGSVLYIIVVLDMLVIANYNSLAEMTRRLEEKLNNHKHRLIILSPLTAKEEPSEKSLLVRDLTQEARNQIFLDNNQLYFFGSSTSIESIVQKTDKLSFMFKVLDYYAETKATDRTNVNRHNYEKIKCSYIQRDVEPYSPSRALVGHSNREIKKCFEYLKGSIGHQTYTFDEMIHAFHEPVCKPVYESVQSALAEKEEQHDITNLFDNENRNKCKVLLSEAGFGKSTYFTWLAWRIADSQPSLFVVRLNANEYCSIFDRLKEDQNQLSDSKLIQILYRLVSLALAEPNLLQEESRELGASLLCFSNGQVVLDESKTTCLPFEQLFLLRLFCSKFNAKQLVLLLDAYDEIVPDYTDIVIKCFAGFSKFDGIRNIYFSSRPYEFQDDFKKAITNCRIFQLKPFSHYHQILSLHKHLLSEVTEYEHLENNFQPAVLSAVYSTLINRLDDLVSAPLLLHLAIDSLLPIIRQHINFSSNTISRLVFSNVKLQSFEIIKSFVDKKLEILHIDKSELTMAATKNIHVNRKIKQFNKQFERVHAIMAIYVLFDKKYVDKIVSKQELLDIMEEIEQGDQKTGIIVGFKNNIPLFAHKTFAEYMAALWIFKNQHKLKDDSYFKSQMFWMRGFDRIREFFNQMVVRKNDKMDIHVAVMNKSLEEVKAIIENDASLVTARDSGGRIPLLLALQHDNHDIMLLLLETMSSINKIDLIDARDDLFHWRALDYAFVMWNKNAIKALLDFGASINISTLCAQLFSNDNDNLLIQAYHYVNQLASAEDRKHLSEYTVDHLLKERKIDINDKRERLEQSTALQYCIAKKAYELFEQFILHLDKPEEYLSSMGDQLIKAALAKNAYNIVCFLVDKFDLHPPPKQNKLSLCAALLSAIELGRMRSFKIFLEQLCLLLNIECVSDTTIVVDDAFENIKTKSSDEANDKFPKSCCVRKSKTVLLPLPEYSDKNVFEKDHLFESLLARAAHVGNVAMMNYVVQKIQKPITNRTIVTVMRLMPKGKRLIHDQSIKALKFLLHQTTDLESIDEHGRNLLHMTIQNGCFFMVQCLIEADFDRTMINKNNGWNIFHYIAASESSHNNRAFKLLELCESLEHSDLIQSVDVAGNSVYETAIIHNNFDIARDMIETTFIDSATFRKEDFVLGSVERLVEKLDEFKTVLDYFKYLFEFGDIMWMKAYSTIRASVLVI